MIIKNIIITILLATLKAEKLSKDNENTGIKNIFEDNNLLTNNITLPENFIGFDNTLGYILFFIGSFIIISVFLCIFIKFPLCLFAVFFMLAVCLIIVSDWL